MDKVTISFGVKFKASYYIRYNLAKITKFLKLKKKTLKIIKPIMDNPHRYYHLSINGKRVSQ